MQADTNYLGMQQNSVQAIRRALFTEVKSFCKAWERWKKKLKPSQVVLSFRIILVQLIHS